MEYFLLNRHSDQQQQQQRIEKFCHFEEIFIFQTPSPLKSLQSLHFMCQQSADWWGETQLLI